MKNIFKKNTKQESEIVMGALTYICMCCILVWFTRTILLCYNLGKDDTDDLLWQVLSQGITLIAMALCSLFIWQILSNVKRNEIFTKGNANLIVFVGASVEINGFLQYILTYFTPDEYIDETYMIYVLLGVFLLFIGCLFKTGVQMKEEQDLTI